jgi:hypothetical protein
VSNTKLFLTSMVEPWQLLEETIHACIAQRNVNVAAGFQLTQLGELVGMRRSEQTTDDDEVYRRFVRAKIAINKSDGQPEQIYKVARLMLGDTVHTLEIDNQGAAAYVLRIGDDLLADDIAAHLLTFFVKPATSGGVRAILEWYPTAVGDTMHWGGPGVWGDNWAAGAD